MQVKVAVHGAVVARVIGVRGMGQVVDRVRRGL